MVYYIQLLIVSSKAFTHSIFVTVGARLIIIDDIPDYTFSVVFKVSEYIWVEGPIPN